MKNEVCLPPNQHDVIQHLLQQPKQKKLKPKKLTLQEKRIVHKAIKIYCFKT
jgi:hypothetical protein